MPGSESTSSTEAAQARLDAFFREELAPLAEALRARGVRFYPRGPGSEEATAWLTPDFGSEFERFDTPAELAEALAGRWRDEGLPELAALAPALAALAAELEMTEDAADEVSPFVYVMY